MNGEEFTSESVKVADWIVDGTIRAGKKIALPALLSGLGDAPFLQQDNQGLVKKSWSDESLFACLYGAKVKVAAFGDVSRSDWHQQSIHRRAIGKAAKLRTSWAGRWNRVTGCRFVVDGVSHWDRKLNRQMIAQLQAKLDQAKVGVRWSALNGGLPQGLTREQLVEKTKEAMAEIETTYRHIYFGGMTAHLRMLGYTTPQGIDTARHGLERVLARYWKWVGQREENPENVSTRFGVKALQFDDHGEPVTVTVEILNWRQTGRLCQSLGGIDNVKTLLIRLEELFKGIAGASTAAPPVPWIVETARRMGLSLGHGATGRLVRNWKRVVAESLLAQIEWRGDGDVTDVIQLVEQASRKVMEKAGLISSTLVRWEGEVVVMPLTEQAAKVSAHHLFHNMFVQAGLPPTEIKPGLGLLDAADSRHTVYRAVFADRLPPDARQWWDELESQRESVFVTVATGDLRLRALHDGVARSYLSLIGMVPDSATDSPFGMGNKFWEEVQSGCSPQHLGVMTDAAQAAQIWAYAQLLGGGESWLGLSPSYMRFLRRAFSLLLPVAGFFRDGTWNYEGKDLLAGHDLTETAQAKLLSSLSGQPDSLLVPLPLTDDVEIAGVRIGKSQLVPMLVAKSARQYLYHGYFRSDSGSWNYQTHPFGAALPGLTNELQSRVYAHLIDLFCWGNNGHNQAVLRESLTAVNGGEFPPALLPLLPVGFSTWRQYAVSIRDGGGCSFADLIWRQPPGCPTRDHLARLATFDQPLNEPVVSKHFLMTAPTQWKSIVERPSLGGFNGTNLTAVINLARALTNLAKGLHPMTLAPLTDGGGVHDEAKEWVRRVWSPMFASGRCPATSGTATLAPALLPLQHLVQEGLGSEKP